MRIIRLLVTVGFVAVYMGLAFPTVSTSFGESGLRKHESGGLSFRYSSDLKIMSSSSAEKIRSMLNAQMKGMGNSQSSVVALDVLLDLPAYRVLISKERFVAEPTPHFLIQEKQYFFAEAKKRGAINSYGKIQEKSIAGYPTIEFKDIDKGAQGYGSTFTILCGMDTWNFSFTGNNRENYEKHGDHMNRIMSSIEISGTCKRSDKVLS